MKGRLNMDTNEGWPCQKMKNKVQGQKGNKSKTQKKGGEERMKTDTVVEVHGSSSLIFEPHRTTIGPC